MAVYKIKLVKKEEVAEGTMAFYFAIINFAIIIYLCLTNLNNLTN